LLLPRQWPRWSGPPGAIASTVRQVRVSSLVALQVANLDTGGCGKSRQHLLMDTKRAGWYGYRSSLLICGGRIDASLPLFTMIVSVRSEDITTPRVLKTSELEARLVPPGDRRCGRFRLQLPLRTVKSAR
ncbi:unnamed protein product, partial [Amoebophrya sp. A120]